MDLSKFTHFYSDAVDNEEYVAPEDEIRVLTTPDSTELPANLLNSKVPGDPERHYLFLDLDIPHTYMPSSTEGHGHLIIEKPMGFNNMMYLLRTLMNSGILQQGFVELTEKRGAAFLRHPNSKKPQKKEEDFDPLSDEFIAKTFETDGDSGEVDLFNDPWGFNSKGPSPF